MNYKKLIGYGVGMWAAAYIAACLFVARGVMEGMTMSVTVAVVGIVASFIFSRKLGALSVSNALCYGIGWVVIAAILDTLLTVPFTGWKVYSHWDMWVGYAALFAMPFITGRILAKPQAGI